MVGSPEFFWAAAVAAVVFLVGVVWLCRQGPRTRTRGRGHSGAAPSNLRYVCASCAGRFTHTRRTLAAWERGAKSYYCHACHTRSLTTPKPKPWQLVPGAHRKTGCLGALLLMAAVPLVLSATAWHFFV